MMAGMGVRRAAVVAALMAAVIAGYTVPNHWHLREPVALPLSALDRAVPFVPLAMLVYVSHYLFLPGCLLAVRDERLFARLAGAMLVAAALSDAVFALVPTFIARPPMPGGLAGPLFAFIASVDKPFNCFPSQHVALAALGAWGLREDGHPRASLALAWAAAISASTVLVRQHYAADVAGGLALAALSWRASALACSSPAPERGHA
jgi:membrane-associated phospholipid phosphatase